MHEIFTGAMLKLCVCLFLVSILSVKARDRVYFLTAEEVEWDYAQGGRNIVDNRQEDADVFLKRSSDRIGRIYTKCVYKQYTDLTYQTEIAKPVWMGILGPTLRAEVGDRMIVNFWNRCFRPFTVHPHGVMYAKDQEGALYMDGTSGSDKQDDGVPTGGRYKYIWEIPENFAPSPDDPTCLSWAYHSHVDAVRDTNSGLIGLLLACKRGSLMPDNTRKDRQKDLAMLFKIFNEDVSWYLERNLAKCENPAACKQLAVSGDEDFAESNLLHAINGALYGTLPVFQVCEKELVNWHLMGMGTEVDLHTVLIHGQTLLYNKHRKTSVGLFAAEFKTAMMISQNAGRWLINCQVNDHYTAGMQAFLDVRQCRSDTQTFSSLHRVHYLAAEEVTWNYAPSGLDGFNGGSLARSDKDSAVYYEHSLQRIGGIYKKARFFEYTDRSYGRKKTITPEEEHLGILGPVIRAEVGETIIVVFRNSASRNYSLQAHGVSVLKDGEGSKYNDKSKRIDSLDNEVPPGATYVYFWYVPEEVGPSDLDPDCITNFYQSGVDPVRDTSSGLVGPLLVCKKGSLTTDGQQKNIDKEFVLMFTIFDENLSWYIDDNIRIHGLRTTNTEDEDFVESNKMRSINGRGYGNLEGLTVKTTDCVSWHLIGLGTESDLHSVHFHGNTLVKDGSRVDTIAVFPGTTATAIMTPENTGVWGLVSRTDVNFIGGMTALYRVVATSNSLTQAQTLSTGVTRTLYIAAVERLWDFAPTKTGIIKGESLYNEDSDGYIFVRNDTGFIGSTYKKVLYRQFTDSSFQVEMQRDDTDLHLGMMGPYIRAEVGDVINIVFKNMASRPYTIYPHGIVTDKRNEGALYEGSSTRNSGASVASGSTFTYTWYVPKKSGPAEGDPNCIAWPYYSHVNPVRDVNSGLIGPLVICRNGVLDANSRRRDKVDKEFTLLFTVTNENKSWYIDENIRTYAPTRTDLDDPDFEESNLMHGINGRIYGNNNGIEMNNGDVAAWYVLGMGTEIDIHTVHFHGQTLLHKQQVANRVDVIEVFPGISETLEMQADNPGTWLLHCHISDHLQAGMETVFTIRDNATQTTPNTNAITTAAPLPTVCSNPAVWRFLTQSWPQRASALWNALCNRRTSSQVRRDCLGSSWCRRSMQRLIRVSRP